MDGKQCCLLGAMVYLQKSKAIYDSLVLVYNQIFWHPSSEKSCLVQDLPALVFIFLSAGRER